MNYGPLLFLATFFALAGSWFTYVLVPQVQIGRLQPTNSVPAGATYPVARPGLAREGLEVYRANGCAYCHSQQLGQTGTVCDVSLTDAGTNQAALVAELVKLKPDVSEAQAKEMLSNMPAHVETNVTIEAAKADVKALSLGGAKVQLVVRPVGPDIERGWGSRRTVAEDFLYDYPVMLGEQRIGPDLANVGARRPDVNWHVLHLYSARTKVEGSTMPPYRFLFEKRKIGRVRSPDALDLKGELAPPAGYEVVPKTEAKALVAYLLSLRADTPLFVAPWTSAATSASTNASGK